MIYLLEIFLEFFGLLVFEVTTNFIFFKLQSGQTLTRRSPSVFLGLLVIGSVFGFLSTYVYESQISDQTIKILNLLATPIFMGAVMQLVGWLKLESGRTVVALDHFLGGYMFALGFVLVRFFIV